MSYILSVLFAGCCRSSSSIQSTDCRLKLPFNFDSPASSRGCGEAVFGSFFINGEDSHRSSSAAFVRQRGDSAIGFEIDRHVIAIAAFCSTGCTDSIGGDAI